MSGRKYSFSKEIAESLGITEAIILDFFQNNQENFSLDNLKNEFKLLDFKKLAKKKNIKVFDMRNIYSLEKMKKLGINYFSIGR